MRTRTKITCPHCGETNTYFVFHTGEAGDKYNSDLVCHDCEEEFEVSAELVLYVDVKTEV